MPLKAGSFAAIALLSGCSLIQGRTTDAGTSSVDAGPGCGAQGGVPCVVTIQNFTYAPEALNVAPGAVVTVKNMDTMVHTATSEASAGAFKAGISGGVSFNTGEIPSGKEGTFTIPAGATVGAIVYYFCERHPGSMTNEPHITVVR